MTNSVCKLRLFDTECCICNVDQTSMVLINKKWPKSFLTIWSNQDEEKMLPVVEKLCSTLYFHPGFFLLSLAFSLPQMRLNTESLEINFQNCWV